MIEPHRTESIVRQRYAAGAKERADKLCCPVAYDSAYLKAIPQEVIERDYGCGDPSQLFARRRSRCSILAAAREKFVSSPRKSSGQKAKSSAST